MCGIAATIDMTGRGRAAPWALELLRHRGPDGAGVLSDPGGNATLEHTRLAILDPDNPEADQPFSDPSGRWSIVYNGEIFNFREIRSELEQRGIVFRTGADTEVLLLGFLHEGERILERLRGMFAFLVWDSRTGEAFAARDHIGVKPFYYLVGDGMFAACSEMRPLLRHPACGGRLDPTGVTDFLSFGGNFGEGTLIEGVRKLLPGHCLRVREGQVRVREYWDVLGSQRGTGSLEDAGEELRERLGGAVGASLVSDVPVGLMLSGGVDSSAVAALAARQGDASALTAYSVDFGRPDDESVAARRLAAELGMAHKVILVSEAKVRDDFEDWLDALDYPGANPTWIASSFIARAANADGIKVLLGGDGGDELFGGYTRWMKYLRFHDLVWRPMPRAGRRVGGLVARRFAPGLAGDIARRASEGGGLFVPSRPFHDDTLAACLGPVARAAAAAHPPERIIEELRRRFDERMPGGDHLAWMSYASLKTHMVEDFLQRLDKMGMRHSVEGRVPLLDPTLARWAFALPRRAKAPRYRQKAVLRAATAPLLPRYVLERPKQGFCPPVASWVEDLLLGTERITGDDVLVEEGLVHPEAMARLRATGRRGLFGAWTLGMLSEWCRRNLGATHLSR